MYYWRAVGRRRISGAFFVLICAAQLCIKNTRPMSKKGSKNSNSTAFWIIGGLALLGVGYLWLRQQLGLIQVGAPSIPFQKLDGATIRLGIKLPIVNASALSARITGFSGFILTPEGRVLSTVFLAKPATINRYEEAELEFVSLLRLTDLATEIFGIVTGGGAVNWKGYKIKGQLRVYGLPVPIETAIV